MIKIITGFRDDQYFIIEDEEAHKAYFLFSNPEARTIFNNGVALIGKSIQGIEPAYNETMGWNPTHKLDHEDWNELRAKRVTDRFRDVLSLGKQISLLAESNTDLLKLPMSEVKKTLLLS